MTKGKIKKVWAIVLAAILAMGVTACSSSDDSNRRDISRESRRTETSMPDVEENDTESKEEQDVSEEKETKEESYEVEQEDNNNRSSSSVTINEQVLLDEDGIKVTAKEYVYDDLWGEGIKLLIENDSDTDIGLSASAIIINDYMITDTFTEKVAAGKKSNEVMYFSDSELEKAEIDNVGKIEIYFHTYDADSYKTIKNYNGVTLETSCADYTNAEPADFGIDLYESDMVRIVGKYVDEDSIWGAEVLLYIENKSDQNIIIQCEDLSVNGFMVSGSISTDVYVGKKAVDELTIFSSDLEENDITTIEDIELVFKVISDDYRTLEKSDSIKFSID